MIASSPLVRLSLGAALALAVSSGASAAVVYDEAVDGALSSDAGNPTLVDFVPGSNEVVGSMGPGVGTNDFFTFVVESGETLNSIFLSAFSGGNISRIELFAGATAGDIFTGFAGASFDTAGITLISGPIGPGTYSVNLQETNTPDVSYTLRFDLSASTAVPEPAGLALLLGGLAGAAWVRRRRAA